MADSYDDSWQNYDDDPSNWEDVGPSDGYDQSNYSGDQEESDSDEASPYDGIGADSKKIGKRKRAKSRREKIEESEAAKLDKALTALASIPDHPPRTFKELSKITMGQLGLIVAKKSVTSFFHKYKAEQILKEKKGHTLQTTLATLEKRISSFYHVMPVEEADQGFTSNSVQILTWNMNGGGQKWRTLITSKSFEGYDFICLQECGPFPGSMKPIWAPGWKGSSISDATDTLLGRWDRFNVFWVHTGGAGTKVQTAILTPHKVTGRALVKSKHLGSRPAVGLEISGKYRCYSYHAWSNGGHGNDAESMIGAVAEANKSGSGHKWILAGDFNREDKTLKKGKIGDVACTACTPVMPTMWNNKKYYDYVIAGWADAEVGNDAYLNASAHSDHQPVGYSVKLTTQPKFTQQGTQIITE